METQKIVNLLNGSDNENSKFATKKWYIIDSEAHGNYSKDHWIKFLTSSLESKLMTLLLIVQILFNITMPMYNLIEYSDNYSDNSGSLWDFKKRWNR